MRFPSAVDPMTEDPRDREDREAEQKRFEDERALLEAFQENPYAAVKACECAYVDGWHGLSDLADHAHFFAADYGWPAVFRVLAMAIHAYDDAQARR